MRCQTCHGTRQVQVFALVPKDARRPDGPRVRLNLGRSMPCPDCLGGEAHCCDGLCAQPEAKR